MKKRFKKSKLAKVTAALAIAALTATMSVSTAFAADIAPGSKHTTYAGPGTTTVFTPTGGTSAAYATPTASDRCQIRYYGVDKYKQKASDVKIVAYHIIEGNYNQYGFLGWTQTKASADTGVTFDSFQKTTDNVAQVVVRDNFQFIKADGTKTNNIEERDHDNPDYNKGLVITSQNITDMARELLKSTAPTTFKDKIELTWSNEEGCYTSKKAKAGTYLILVEKEDRGVIYNPVIVSNDYASANIAKSLSNYIENGVVSSLHDDPKLGFNTLAYEAGVGNEDGLGPNDPKSTRNTVFVGYGTVHPKVVEYDNNGNPIDNTDANPRVTNDNKDKSPQTQTNYKNSHSSVVYYKDTQKNGNVFSVFHSAGSTAMPNEKDVETMALAGVAYAKKSTIPIEKNIREASVPKARGGAVGNPHRWLDGTKEGYSTYDDVSEGDVVKFDLFTQIPYYASGYFKDEDKFIFKVTDKYGESFSAPAASDIKVYAADSSSSTAEDIAFDVVKDANLVSPGKTTYTLVRDNTNHQFSVKFTKEWCLAHPGISVIIRYDSKVTKTAKLGLNGNPNEVYLEYTTLPTTPDNPIPSRGYKFDFTMHYTFSPTAFKMAEDGTIVQVDGDHQVSLENQADIAQGETVKNPLAGAKFKLQRVGTHYKLNAGNGQTIGMYAIPKSDEFTATTAELEADPKTSYNGYKTWFLTSDAKGMIKFNSSYDGVDEGYYTLQEVEAPEGYTINPKIYVIEVKPVFDQNVQLFIGTDIKMGTANLDADGNITKFTTESATFVDGTNYEYDEYQKLIKSYTYTEWLSNLNDKYDVAGRNGIDINTLAPATSAQDSTVNPIPANGSTEIHTTTVSWEHNNDGTPKDTKTVDTDLIGIINTKLTRLPSTGGVGTIAFTIGGFALMGGVVLFMAKKKKKNSSEEE